MPITVFKQKPWLHSGFGLMSGESAGTEGWISSPKWEPTQLAPSQGLEPRLCHALPLPPASYWQDPQEE